MNIGYGFLNMWEWCPGRAACIGQEIGSFLEGRTIVVGYGSVRFCFVDCERNDKGSQ